MTKFANRRRLLAGLVFTGVLPVKALAAEASSGTAVTPAPTPAPLPDCILNNVQIASGVTLSAGLQTAGVLPDFVLRFDVPNNRVRLTGLTKLTTDPVRFTLSCALDPTAPNGVAIKSITYYGPGLKVTRGDAPFVMGKSSFVVGRYRREQEITGGPAGAVVLIEPKAEDANYPLLIENLRRSTSMVFTGPAPQGQTGRIVVTYALPRLPALFATAKARLDKLVEDQKNGLCKIPTVSSGYPAKFCTTAAVDTLGLRRNCWELKSLHAFRDWMMADSVRALDAISYNERAPAVVHAIAKRPDALKVWINAYWTGVLPAAALAKIGLNWPAMWVYRGLCARLLRRAGL